MTTLRPYQQRALDDARAAYRAGARSVLLVAPTGAGKGVCAGAVVRSAVAKGNRVLVLAPRREIIGQLSAHAASWGVPHGIIAAGRRNPDADAPVQLAMAQTARSRIDALPPARLVVVDEAHLDVYTAVLDRYPDAHRLLLTATPLRASGIAWHGLADALVEVETVAGLVAAGHLVEPHVWSAETPDLAGIRRTASGELSPTQAGAQYQRATILGDTVQQVQTRCAGLRTLVFASSVEHSRALAEALIAAGRPARHIDGSTPDAERAGSLAWLADTPGAVVTNYGCLCEGLDVPAVGAVVVARSTQSESLWRQMVGRGLRPHHAPGCGVAGCVDGCKARCIVIDQGGNAYRHGHPMAPRTWTLDGREASTPDPDAPPMARTCSECLAIYPAPEPACPRCGAAPIPEPRRPPKALTKAELALLRPDGTPAPTVVVDGRTVAPRPLPDWMAEAQRDVWEAVELRRLRGGYHWRWSLRRLADEGVAVPARVLEPRGWR